MTDFIDFMTPKNTLVIFHKSSIISAEEYTPDQVFIIKTSDNKETLVMSTRANLYSKLSLSFTTNRMKF